MNPITIKRNAKKHNEYSLTAKLTAGQLLALHQALVQYACSPVAADVLDFLNNAQEQAKLTDPSGEILW